MATTWSMRVQRTEPGAPLAAGTELPLAGDLVIGRSRESDLVLDDDRISRRHALIAVREDGLWIEPLGSGALYVGRQPVQGARQLQHDDWLQLGPILFRIRARGTQTLLTVDLETERAWLGGRLLALRPAELNLVRVFATRAGDWLAAEDLAQGIWVDDPDQINVGYVDKYVSYLRRALRTALEDGKVREEVRHAVLAAADRGQVPDEPAALARVLVKSRKKVGYRLQIAPDRVVVLRR